MLFEDFTLLNETLNGLPYRVREAGNGPALMLLHGRPETHVMWHKIAPRLARNFSVICPDLHPERPVAQQALDLLELAARWGHESLVIAGHDYGAYIACQMAKEAPHRVRGLALLEALPFLDHSGRDDMAHSLAQYKTCWFGQLHHKPEANLFPVPTDISTVDTARNDSIFAPEAIDDYLASCIWHGEIANPQPSAHTGITCPIMVLWGAKGRLGGWYEPPSLWSTVSTAPVTGKAIDAEHFLPEEAPDEVETALEEFLASLS
ncbi:alpha/beta fold hydrolase [Acetobacter conturbans]|uniref:Alpha/beta fold hydrolase n=1 Tax=Acetobacter conturbans TaxID=1737472 RepID=A0ABX0JYY8_9PROT|nr:alpha/beta hydrolase [Acetobacter conturbans]NHN87640.1 alpha/beta fold hydrolase [Acetobacter conturbans]